jgi:hypothetical protein
MQRPERSVPAPPATVSGALHASDEQAWVSAPPALPEDPWALARRELERSRRYGHPLALLRVVPLGPAQTIEGELAQPRRSRRVRSERIAVRAAADLVLALRDSLRDIDAVWSDRRGVFMLLPESDAAAGTALVQRLRTGERPLLSDQDDVRVGAFPADGLTLDAMIAAVTRPVPAPALPVMLGEDEGAPMRRRLRSTAGRSTAEGVADQAG